MKKLLFVAVLLTAGLTNQVNASSNAQQLYQNFQNSLVAVIQSAQKVDNVLYSYNFANAYGDPGYQKKVNITGIPDFSRLIALLTTLSGSNLSLSLNDFITPLKDSTLLSELMNIKYNYFFPSSIILYYKTSSVSADIHSNNNQGYYMTQAEFQSSLLPSLEDFITAAIALNIPTLKCLVGILEGLPQTGSNMSLADYSGKISDPVARIKTLPGLLKYFNIQLPS